MQTEGWRLEVSYDPGMEITDEDLCNVVGRDDDASGSGFGGRDLAWYFKKFESGKKALDRVKKFAKKHERSFYEISLSLIYNPE